MKKQIIKIAQLSRLSLNKDEINALSREFKSIIRFVNKLKDTDVRGVKPTSQVTNLENIFRDDKVKHSISQKEALSQAKEVYKGYFKVNAILDY